MTKGEKREIVAKIAAEMVAAESHMKTAMDLHNKVQDQYTKDDEDMQAFQKNFANAVIHCIKATLSAEMLALKEAAK